MQILGNKKDIFYIFASRTFINAGKHYTVRKRFYVFVHNQKKRPEGRFFLAVRC